MTDSSSSAAGEAPGGPLAGLRVIELAHVMAGPVCGLVLADMGADVVKIERVPAGDPSRRFLPPEIHGESAAFMMMNRNKRGIAVDLRSSAGRDVVLRLVESADVLIENYRPGALERLGLGYAELSELRPELVYGSISGFGRTGPYAERGGFDLIAQGYSGLMSITGERDGDGPVKCGVPITDVSAGILAATGILAALWRRQTTGRGEHLDTSLFEAGITTTFWQSAITLATGQAPGPMGTAHPLNAPYQAFRTADGWLTLGTSNQANWEKLPAVLGDPRLAEDERFADNASRVRHRDELEKVLGATLVGRTTGEWIERLDAAGIPAGPVLSVAEMLEHPQTRARDMVVEVDHPRAGRVATLGPPVKFRGAPAAVRRAAPTLGQHTREVLLAAGVSGDRIRALEEDGVLVCDGGS